MMLFSQTWACNAAAIPLAELDKFWEVLVALLLSESCGPGAEHITGARVIDKVRVCGQRSVVTAGRTGVGPAIVP